MRVLLLISLLSLCSCGSNQVRSSSNIEIERRMKNVLKQDKIMFKKVMKARRRGARFVLKLAK